MWMDFGNWNLEFGTFGYLDFEIWILEASSDARTNKAEIRSPQGSQRRLKQYPPDAPTNASQQEKTPPIPETPYLLCSLAPQPPPNTAPFPNPLRLAPKLELIRLKPGPVPIGALLLRRRTLLPRAVDCDAVRLICDDGI
jgi:hypothetical protein